MRVGRLFNLVTQLPPESATAQRYTEQPVGAWPVTDQLLAMLLEHLDVANRMTVKVWGKKQVDGKPLRVEWPGRTQWKAAPKVPSTPAEIRKFMGGGGGGRVAVIDPGGNGGA